MTGMHALRKACLITTIHSATPLARAVLMYSMLMTSIDAGADEPHGDRGQEGAEARRRA